MNTPGNCVTSTYYFRNCCVGRVRWGLILLGDTLLTTAKGGRDPRQGFRKFHDAQTDDVHVHLPHR